MKILLSAFVLVILSSCSSIPSLSFPGVYKLNIPQGNIITQKKIDQLRPGLSKRQVNFILGTPLIKDTFDQDRWDYIYSLQIAGSERVQENLTVFFENNELTHFTGDFQQSPEKEQFNSQIETGN